MVENERMDTMSRECLRYDEFKDVKLLKVEDHFICNCDSYCSFGGEYWCSDGC